MCMDLCYIFLQAKTYRSFALRLQLVHRPLAFSWSPTEQLDARTQLLVGMELAWVVSLGVRSRARALQSRPRRVRKCGRRHARIFLPARTCKLFASPLLPFPAPLGQPC